MGYEVAFSSLVGLVPSGDEVDGDASSAGEIIERRCHSCQHDRLNESGTLSDKDFEALRVMQDRRRYRPTLWSYGAVADQHPIESTFIVGLGDGDQVREVDHRTIHPVDDRTINEWALYLGSVSRSHHSDYLDWHRSPPFLQCHCTMRIPQRRGRHQANSEMNANIRDVVTGTPNLTSSEKRPLVAVGYGPRCVPVMQLTQAAAGICDILWMIDGSLPEMQEMTDLLNRVGPVVDVHGLDVDQILKELSAPYRPDGIVTYLDANMTMFASVAAALALPFHSVETAVALTDKFQQRQSLADADIDVPACHVVPTGQSLDESVSAQVLHWPAVLKPRSAQGSRFTFFVDDEAELERYLETLGPQRPDMVLEDYLADDPARADELYAAYVSVESVVSHGAISHVALTGRFPMAENFRETGFFIPAVLSKTDQEAVLQLATSATEALGVHTGCLHTEVKFTADGPRVIEVNGRVGGGVPEMLHRASGIGLLELTLRLALGESIRIDGPVTTERIGYRFFLQPPDVSATVATISGIDAVSEHPGVDTITVHQGPGANLDWRDGTRNHIVAVVGSAKDYAELLSVNRLLNQEVTVTYANVNHYW
jgi:biotin carboxylase